MNKRERQLARRRRLAELLADALQAGAERAPLQELWQVFGDGQPETVDILSYGAFARFCDRLGLRREGKPTAVVLDAAARKLAGSDPAPAAIAAPEAARTEPAPPEPSGSRYTPREIETARILRGWIAEGHESRPVTELRDLLQERGHGWRDTSTASALPWLRARGIYLRMEPDNASGQRADVQLDEDARAFVLDVLGECPAVRPMELEWDVEPMGDLIHPGVC